MNFNHTEEIDLVELAKALLKKIWIIAGSAVLGTLVALLIAILFVTPKYKTSALLYVYNKDAQSSSISSADLTASKSLVSTYGVILKSETTLSAVAEKSGLDISTSSLKSMISSASVSSTEVLQITVETSDPVVAQKVANAVVEVLPQRISEIITGTTANVVDYAKLPTAKSSPSYSKYALIGFAVGLILSCAVVALIYLLDDVVHGEEYLQQYTDIPVLASIPDFSEKSAKKYGYYQKYGN